MAQTTDAFDVVGFVEQKKQLESLIASSPRMAEDISGIIRKVLRALRSKLSSDAKSEMKSDPRQAYKAVKMAVYRQILGGNVNILQRRSAGASGSWEPQHSLRQGQRGGNRRTRSARTRQLDSYMGADRGFILRFLNSGAGPREIANFSSDERRAKVNRGSRGGDVSKYGKLSKVNTGNRGTITARGWFSRDGVPEMNNAVQELASLIDELINEKL